MAVSPAAKQAAYRNRQREEVEQLRRRVAELEGRPSGHAACDALEAKLRAEIAQLKGQVRF